MMHRHSAMVMVLASLGLSFWALAGAPPADTLPADVFTRLVTEDAKYIQSTLTKDKIDKRTARKVKATALMIAQYAQANMSNANAKEMATLRDKALELIKAVEDEKMPEARALAATLSAKPKADPAAKTEKIPLPPHLELEYVMRQFSGERIGGFGLENELEALVNVKGALPPEMHQKAIDLSYKILMIGNLAHGYVPEKDEPKGKTKKNWVTFASQMRQTAVGLTQAAKMNKDIGVAADALSMNCTKCHDVFK